MGQYLPAIVLLILTIAFGIVSLGASHLLAPRRPSKAKVSPYECGIVPHREPPQRFPVSFYIVAMLFVMFDIEIIFLYPYAVASRSLGQIGFWAMVEFSVIFFLTFVYAVARGALEWGPMHRFKNLESEAELVASEPLSTTSVRRVGLVGREHLATSEDAA